MDKSADPEKSQLANEIASLVEARFGETRQVSLLAFVGQALSRRGIDFKKILGEQGLGSFIREEMNDRLALTAHPNDSKVLAAFPSEIDIHKEIDPFGFNQPKTRPAPTSRHDGKKELLHSKIWFAFSHTLPDSYVRMVYFEPEIDYRDFEPDQPVPDGGFAVPRESIVPAGTLGQMERNARIYANVEAWAEKESLKFSDLIARRLTKGSARNLLEALLSSLKQEDLARVKMPLDIIERLRTTSV